MKIEKLTEDNLIVFLNKIYIDKCSLLLNDNLEEYFKNLFKILNKYYNIEISGYYDICIYEDNIYGLLLDIKREELDFYGYYEDHVDMKISIVKDNKLLFKIDEYSLLESNILKYCYLIKDKLNLYLLPKKTITQYYLGYVTENCKIIYGSNAKKILDRSQYINTNKIFV